MQSKGVGSPGARECGGTCGLLMREPAHRVLTWSCRAGRVNLGPRRPCTSAA